MTHLYHFFLTPPIKNIQWLPMALLAYLTPWLDYFYNIYPHPPLWLNYIHVVTDNQHNLKIFFKNNK